MLFAVLCVDKPNHISLRMATRPSHVEFLNGLNAQGILKMAGPFLARLWPIRRLGRARKPSLVEGRVRVSTFCVGSVM